jgi:hypothetical protein
MTTFTIDIPQDLGNQLAAAGLFSQAKVTTIFQNALVQNRRSQLFDTIRTSQRLGDDLIPYADIQNEIKAARHAALAA